MQFSLEKEDQKKENGFIQTITPDFFFHLSQNVYHATKKTAEVS